MPEETVLIVGSGAREHALGMRLSSPQRKLYFAPGNPGTASIGTNIAIASTDVALLARFAKKQKVTYTIVGPEDPIALGIANIFAKKSLPIFAPTKEAGQLESSKAWAVVFMQRHHIPHPFSVIFHSPEKAQAFLKTHWKSYVLKADGLAAGKGVVLPDSLSEAQKAVEEIMIEQKFGAAGKILVVQERMSGPEVSLLALSDGKTIVPLLTAQDHKRLNDNDTGPNTGGMGAYAPVPFVSKQLLKRIQKTILEPTISNMRKEGHPFVGVLFVGLMLTKKGPVVLEYNARFGDPETQVLMMLLRSDLGKLITACIQGTLAKKMVSFHAGSAATVVLAAAGYPASPRKGAVIQGLAHTKQVSVFHAGTAQKSGKVVVAGGRVLAVTARGKTLSQALTKVYKAIGKKKIHFSGMQYRKDIGNQALRKGREVETVLRG